MGKDLTCVVAGFGGQGSLFAGKVIATAGLIEDREVSWMPSYGPEMRGGTANCSVTLSDKPIGSPLITRPSALIALNQPSFDKFIDNVEEGGIVVVDTAMVPSLTEPKGVTVIGIPATKMCEEAGLKGLGNIVEVIAVDQLGAVDILLTVFHWFFLPVDTGKYRPLKKRRPV